MLVSILIPTYKRADYLRDAIRSALAQTHEHLEVLVLDDASPDHTASVAREFVDDTRLRYLRNPMNLGIVGNWRVGIDAAKGDFFCFLHDDDTFEPTFVESLLPPLLADNDLIYAFSDHWLMDAAGNRLPRLSDENSRRYKRDTLTPGRVADVAGAAVLDGRPPIGATLFRKSMVPSSFIIDQAKGSIDAWLFYQCVKTGKGAFYVAERLMNYRTGCGGMSATMTLYMAEGHLFRYRTILADSALVALHPAVKARLAKTLTEQGIDLLTTGERYGARNSLQEAVRISPSLRGLVALGLTYGGSLGVQVTTCLRSRA